MLVALHTFSKLIKGVYGVYYTKDVAFDFEINESTTFQELKQLIYKNTVVNANRYEIELATRIDNSQRGGVGGRPYFVRYHITDANLWRVVYTQFESSGVPAMDLYSKRVPRTGVGPSRVPQTSPSGYDNQGYDDSSYDNHGYHESSYYNQGYHDSNYDNQWYHDFSYENQRYHNSHEFTEDLPPPPPSRQAPIIPRYPTIPESEPVKLPVNQNDTEIDVDGIDVIPQKEMETGDEYQGFWESDDLSDSDANEPSLHREDKFLVIGLGNSHPVATFNDTTAFEKADISYFSSRIVYNEKLAPGQLYTNIDVIEIDIKDDPSMSIKEVAKAVKCKYQHVIPKYNKL